MRKFGLSLLLPLLVGCAAQKRVPLPAAAEPAAVGATVIDAPWRQPRVVADGRARAGAKAKPTLIRGARLLIGDGQEIKRGFVLMSGGRIVALGEGDGEAPANTTIIDAAGKTVTPGLIDTHSHLGVYPTPAVSAHMDGNEMTTPLTPGVRVVDAFWPQDPGIQRAVAGGVTTIQALPGSGNLIGGRAVTLKLRPATDPRKMQFAGAPDGLKMACGENPKRVYGMRKAKPMTRMGNLAVQRGAFLRAKHLIDQWDQWREKERDRIEAQALAEKKHNDEVSARKNQRARCTNGSASAKQCNEWVATWKESPLSKAPRSSSSLPPKRDLDLETLAGAIEGSVLVHIHCYRADDMAAMMALSDEMGFAIRSFHHALEAYKIRQVLSQRRIAVSTWADWWGFKMEAYDGIVENLALVDKAGGLAVVHSDSREGIRRLNQEAAKGLFAGIRAGLPLSEATAIRWITQNPAWALGIDKYVGTLTAGKQADVVIWDRTPFSVYARAERVFIDGAERLNTNQPQRSWSDFEAAP